MKMMLTLFVLTVLCSYAFTSQLETYSNSNSLVSSGSSANTLWKKKDSILLADNTIYSKNGKFSITMVGETCQIVVKQKSGKILYRTIKTKKRNCYAVLHGNSDFEIMSGKHKVWGTNTSNKEKGKGPYRLTINNKGNAIVRNNQSKCAWALFGCPVSKSKLMKIKKAAPKKQFQLIKKLMKKQAKKRGGLPIKQLPIARGKPKIKNQLPKILKRKSKPKLKKKLIIKQKKVKKMKNLIKKGGKKALRKLTKSLKKIKVPKKQLKALKKLVKKGTSWKKMRKIAMKKLKRIQKKEVKKIKKTIKKNKGKKPKKIKTKKQLLKKVKKLTWMQQIKSAIMRRVNPVKVKNMMKRLGNVKGNVRFWAKMTQNIQQKNWNQVARLIALPEASKRNEFKRPKRWVTRGRYVRYYATWRTWRWRGEYRIWYQRYCRRYWWWRRCWTVYRRQYYTYRLYYWTGQYRYRYTTTRSLE
jgi:hypothetical protein